MELVFTIASFYSNFYCSNLELKTRLHTFILMWKQSNTILKQFPMLIDILNREIES